MTIRLMALPLLCVVGVATAAGGEKEAMGAQGEPVAVQDKVQAQEQMTVRGVKRQGGDMRHCLDKKTTKAIIRCAEPGRKP